MATTRTGSATDSSRLVSPIGTIGLVAYKVIFTVLIIYLLAKLWPYPTPNLTPPSNEGATEAEQRLALDTTAAAAPADTSAAAASTADTATRASAYAAGDSLFIPVWLACRTDLVHTYRNIKDVRDYSAIPKCVSIFGKKVSIWDEQRLLFMILLAGALGAMVHSIRSMSSYIGDQQLMWNGVPYYILLPFAGSAIALIFYVVIRGGFFSSGADFNETNPFGFVAVAALVGLFSQSAILKLQSIAYNIFEKPPAHSDSLEVADDDKTPAVAATITNVTRKAAVAGGAEDVVHITGTGFTESSKAEVNGKPFLAVFEGATLLTVQLEPAHLAVLDNGGELRIAVLNGDQRSNEMPLT
jgi:hypothetical protein